MTTAARQILRRALLATIVGLYVLSIPWYREGGDAPAIWWGLPDWVAVALGCYVAIAVLNCAAWLLADVPDDEPGSDPT